MKTEVPHTICRLIDGRAFALALWCGLAIAATCLPVWSQASAQPVASATLTIGEAIAVAEQNSPILKVARENFRRAGGVVTEARGSARWNLGINASYTRYDKVEEAEFGSPDGPSQTIQIGEIDSKRATATLAHPIDISGILGAGVDAAEYRRDAAEADLDAARQDLALNVRWAYLRVLQTRENSGVAQESVERLREYLRLAEVRLEAGTAPQFDVLRAQTELANAEQTMIAAQNSVRVAEVTLANVLGVKLPDHPALQPPPTARKDVPASEDLVQQGQQMRPEARAAELEVKAAERGVHIAKRGLRPTMSVAANYNYNGNTTVFQSRTFTADAVAAVSIPIFDSGVTRGRIEQAEADVESANALQVQTDLNIRLEVEQAHVSIVNAQRRLDAAQATLTQATESLRLARVRYESGVGEPIEVTDAQVALTQAQTNLVTARFDLLLAYADLARATGNPEWAAD